MQLIIKQKVIALGDTYNIVDTAGIVVFKGKSRLISPFAHKKYLKDGRSGKTLMTIKRKVFSWGRTYIIKSADGSRKAKVNQPPFSMRMNLTITGYGENLAVQGNFLSREWTLYENGNPIGSVTKAFTVIADEYGLSINNPQDAPFFCAVVIAVDNMRYN